MSRPNIMGIPIALGVYGSMFLAFIVWGFWTKWEIYFLRLKLENHPALIQMLDTTLERIRKEQNIPVFYKSYDELNKGVVEESKKAMGLYIYHNNADGTSSYNSILEKIEDLEREYGKTYQELCKMAGVEFSGSKNEFVFPRIELCSDEPEIFGLSCAYSTYFHELGHHIAITTTGDNSEEAANAIGFKLVKENLPSYFQLIPIISFRYRMKAPSLSLQERLRAYYDFWKYKRITK